MAGLEGIHMELDDCAFPTLAGVVRATTVIISIRVSKIINYVVCVGSIPRKQGMGGGDLIRINGPIFTSTGRAIEAAAAKDVRVLVVGNPCNTNCLIAMNNAPKRTAGSLVCDDAARRKQGCLSIGHQGGPTRGLGDGDGDLGNHKQHRSTLTFITPRSTESPPRRRSPTRTG